MKQCKHIWGGNYQPKQRCDRPARKGDTLCAMHWSRKLKGQDMDAPPRGKKRRSLSQSSGRYDPIDVRKYIESLKITEGPDAGKNIKLIPWQIQAIEGICENRYTGISMGRGNGKTTFIAGIGAAAIDPDGPLFISRGQVVIVGRLLKQAGIAFDHVRWFLNDLIYTRPDTVRGYDAKYWQITNTPQEKVIVHKHSGTTLKAVGGEPGAMHGLAPSLIIGDEPAQWPRANNKHVRMRSALKTSMGKQPDSKMFVIGTRADIPDHWFNHMLDTPDPHTFSLSYHVSEKEENYFSMANIHKANPSLKYMPELKTTVLGERDEAKSLGGDFLATYKSLRLNMGTKETDDVQMLVELENWKHLVLTETPPAREGPVFIGIDMGDGTSMTAVAFYWAQTGLLECWGAYPQTPKLSERGRRDGVDDLYVKMQKRGELFVMGRYNTDSGIFIQAMFKRLEDWLGMEIQKAVDIGMLEDAGIKSVNCDNYKKTVVQQAMNDAGLNPEILSARRVGKGPEGSEDIKAFTEEALTGHMKVAHNLILDNAIAHSQVVRDSNGNAAIDKSHQRGRIDVLQASVLAVGEGHRWRKPPVNEAYDIEAMVA